MLKVECECGARLKLPMEYLGRSVSCSRCQKVMRAVSGGGDIEAFLCKITIIEGPERLGEQLLLGGEGTIEIGKMEGKHVRLLSAQVSRNHCRLVPTIHGGWALEDERSTNGVFVNDQRVVSRTLRNGDRMRVGDFVLLYGSPADAEEPVDLDAEPQAQNQEYFSYDVDNAARIAEEAEPEPPAVPVAALVYEGGPVCPSCSRRMPVGAKICITCGIDIKSGRGLVMSRGFDEEDFAEKAREIIRRVSWFLPLNLIPIASEAWGTRKPKAVWTILIVSSIASLLYFPVVKEWGKPSASSLNLMMWSGKREALIEELSNKRKEALKKYETEVEKDYQAETGKKKLTFQEREEIRREVRKLDRELKHDVSEMMPPADVNFYWWQLLTSSLLHEGIFHLAGNMLFLLVFGLRVNELLGNAKMAVVYPLLAVTSAASHHIASTNGPLAPYLGASGAIMGLAGMYFIFFPAQKVHMAFWVRLWPLPYVWWHKIFRMRGFWMLALWIALNDILPMWLKSEDQVAHWAHLGGFLSGVVLALVMLIARLAGARGTDLITLIFGKAAWGIVGRPA